VYFMPDLNSIRDAAAEISGTFRKIDNTAEGNERNERNKYFYSLGDHFSWE